MTMIKKERARILQKSPVTASEIHAHIYLKPLRELGMENLENVLQVLPKIKKKLCCNHEIDVKISYGLTLFILTNFGMSKEVLLTDILNLISVDSIESKLAGLVEYQGTYNPNVPGHYVPYVQIGSHWLL